LLLLNGLRHGLRLRVASAIAVASFTSFLVAGLQAPRANVSQAHHRQLSQGTTTAALCENPQLFSIIIMPLALAGCDVLVAVAGLGKGRMISPLYVLLSRVRSWAGLRLQTNDRELLNALAGLRHPDELIDWVAGYNKEGIWDGSTCRTARERRLQRDAKRLGKQLAASQKLANEKQEKADASISKKRGTAKCSQANKKQKTDVGSAGGARVALGVVTNAKRARS